MANLLPQADWTRREDLATLIAALGPGNARYVGGAVRDTLLGLPVKDVDIATPLLPDDVIARLTAANLKAIPTGIDHGTITAPLPGGPVEITTLRHDVSTDGRRATVAFASDWRDDAARRDFTINALYADPATHEIHDYFNGQADLAARRVRFIGDARQRIREDHLRILRYFRFQARFGSQPADKEAEKSCHALAQTLTDLSRERVAMELLNLLALPDPSLTIVRMGELSILKVILPEANPTGLAALVATEAAYRVAPDPIRRLAALLPANPVVAEQVAVRFRLSTAQRRRLSTAAGRSNGSPDPHVLAYRLGLLEATDRLLLTGRDPSAVADWIVPILPIKGGDIVARGVAPGPEIARLLRAVEDRWVAEGFPDQARVQTLLDEELAE